MRIPFRSLATLLLAGSVATCSDAPTAAPNSATAGARRAKGVLSFTPVFSAAAAAVYAQRSAFADANFDHVRVAIVRPPLDTLTDTTVVFTPTSPDLTLDLTVDMIVPNETFGGVIQYLNSSGRVYEGRYSQLVAHTSDEPAPPQQKVVLAYVGPGANAAKVVVAPKTPIITAPALSAFTATVFDDKNAAISNVPVVWTSSDPTVATISSAGVLTPTGKRGTVIVTATTLTKVTDNATATIVLPAAGISLLSGGGQTGKAGQALAQPAVVRVTAVDGVGVPGVTVNFAASGGGKVSASSVTTDASGNASATLTVGGTVGPQSFAAVAGGFSVSIPETVTAGDPATVAAVSGGGQSDTIMHVLKNPLVVKVTDAFANAVPGVVVTWTHAGTGSLSTTTSTTNADGLASVAYTLGGAAGNETITASAAGVATSATFTAQALVVGGTSYTIDLSTNSATNSCGAVSGAGSYAPNATVTVTATPIAGCFFANWSENGTVVSFTATYSFPATANRSLTANFTQTAAFYIGLSSNPAEGGSANGAGYYDPNSSVTVTANPSAASGYSFVSWTENGAVVSTSINYTFTATANRLLVANFARTSTTVTVSVSANPTAGGTVSGGGTFPANGPFFRTLTAVPNSGYDFATWTENGTVLWTDPVYSLNVTGNRTIVGNFTSKTGPFLITLLVTRFDADVTGAGSYPANSPVTVTAVPKAGTRFTSWTENGAVVSTGATYAFTATANRVLTANIARPVAVTCSASPASGGTITGGGGSYYEGDSISCTATANPGFRFVNWTEFPYGFVVTTSPTLTNNNVLDNHTYIANFVSNAFTVAVSSNPPGGGTVTGGGSYAPNSGVTVTATPNASHRFTNWFENGSFLSSNASYSFIVTANRTLVANFDTASYTITTSVSPSGCGTVSPGGATSYALNSVASYTATPSGGCTFVNWTDNGSVVSTSATYAFTVTANRALVANFTQPTGQVTINLAVTLGAGSVTGAGTYPANSPVTVVATANPGNRFTNWTESGSVVSTSASYSFTATVNRNLTANIARPVTIGCSANPAGAGTVTGGGTYFQGDAITCTATPANGYKFNNWTESGNVVGTSPTLTNNNVLDNHSYVANFTQVFFTVTVSVSASPAAAGSVVGGGAYTVSELPSVTVSATPNSGFTFTNWTENGSVVSTSASYSFAPLANRTLVANFVTTPPTSYTISVSANPSAGGTVGGGGTYPANGNATVTATANTGYVFTNWTQNATVVSSSASYGFVVNADRALVANFAVTTYTIGVSANPAVGGTVSGGGSYPANSSVTVTATPNSSHRFGQWTENGSVVGLGAPSYTFTATANRNLVANFDTASFIITTSVSPSGCGAVSPGGATSYALNSTASYTALPAAGCTFVNWTDNGTVVSSAATYAFTVTANRALVANFTQVTGPFTITLFASRFSDGSVSGGGTYPGNSPVTVVATPNTGIRFTRWTENGATVSTSASYAFTATANRTLTANFARPVTIGCSASPAGSGTVTGGGTYYEGDSVTCTATPATGFKFVNWTEFPFGTVVGTSPTLTNGNVLDNHTYIANFTPTP